MRVNRIWAALALPMVFDRVFDASSAFIAASCAIAALVFGIFVGIIVLGCIACYFWRCGGWLVATGILEIVGDAGCDLVLRVFSSCSASCTLGSVAFGCTLKIVASICCMGTLGSEPGTNVASISSVRLRISCSCFAVTIWVTL